MPESCEEEAETPPVEEPGSDDIFSPESLQSALESFGGSLLGHDLKEEREEIVVSFCDMKLIGSFDVAAV